MPKIRPATPDDAPDLARLHVACWRETYLCLLPEAEISARDEAARLRQWQAEIAEARSRIAILPGRGFAQVGPQRDPALAPDWPEELYCLYLLRRAHGRGHGRALLAAVRSETATTALVIVGNARADAFYRASGAHLLAERDERIGRTAIRERVFGWPQRRTKPNGPESP